MSPSNLFPFNILFLINSLKKSVLIQKENIQVIPKNIWNPNPNQTPRSWICSSRPGQIWLYGMALDLVLGKGVFPDLILGEQKLVM